MTSVQTHQHSNSSHSNSSSIIQRQAQSQGQVPMSHSRSSSNSIQASPAKLNQARMPSTHDTLVDTISQYGDPELLVKRHQSDDIISEEELLPDGTSFSYKNNDFPSSSTIAPHSAVPSAPTPSVKPTPFSFKKNDILSQSTNTDSQSITTLHSGPSATDSSLRFENEQLRFQLAELKNQLTEKDETIANLKRRLQSMERILNDNTSGDDSSIYDENNTVLNPLDTPLQQHMAMDMSRSSSKQVNTDNIIQSLTPAPHAQVESQVPATPSDYSMRPSLSSSSIILPERSERRIVSHQSQLSNASSNYSVSGPASSQEVVSPSASASGFKFQVNGRDSPVVLSPVAPSITSSANHTANNSRGAAEDFDLTPTLSQVTQSLSEQLTFGSSPRKRSPSRTRFVFKNSTPTSAASLGPTVSPLRNTVSGNQPHIIDRELDFMPNSESSINLSNNNSAANSRTSSYSSNRYPSNGQAEPHYKSLTSPFKSESQFSVAESTSSPEPSKSSASSISTSAIKPQYVQYLRQPNATKLQPPPTPNRQISNPLVQSPQENTGPRRTSSSPQFNTPSPTAVPVTPQNNKSFFNKEGESLHSEYSIVGNRGPIDLSPKRYQSLPERTPEAVAVHGTSRSLLVQQPNDATKKSHPQPLTSHQQLHPPISNPCPPDRPVSPFGSQRKDGTDSEFDYLSNSMDTTIISVVSVVDPKSLLHHQNDFDIKFMVNSSERGGTPIPLYRVRQPYSAFLRMDIDLRNFGPINLPKLPDPHHFLKIDPNEWDTQKTIIRMYIAELCRLMRQQKQLAERAPGGKSQGTGIWNVFKNFFVPDDSYDMIRKEGVFVSGSKNLKKNFKLNIFEYDTIERLLFISDCVTGSTEQFHLSEILVTRESSVLNISTKKRKKAFKSKSQQFYSESVQDAEEWFKLISDTQTNGSSMASVTTQSASSFSNHYSMSSNGSSGDYGLSSSMMAPSPSGQSHYTLDNSSIAESMMSPIVHETTSTASSSNKWFNLKRSRDSGMSNQSGGHGGDSSPAVLEFKAMPYSGSLSGNNSTLNGDAGLGLLSMTPNNKNGINCTLPNGGGSEFSSVANTPQQLNFPTSANSNAIFQRLEDAHTKYFGSTLKESYDLCPNFKFNDRPVPSIVYRCLTYLTAENAVYNEGIFRLNGMMAEVNRIQQTFNADYDVDLAQMDPKPDVHSVATLLKRYLRTLKITLIPESSAKKLMSLTLVTNVAKSVPQIKDIVCNELPTLNYDVLYVMFRYFREVLKFKELNKMSVGALSVLMAPNLTPFDGAKEICSALLIDYEYYFEGSNVILEGAARKAV
ncbi:unnamed protein product [Ambrosiozyma monospora]|uniref:Unnamed protein product n=1 Tax=Ambrosiozyma monospora TaxID=43982 RepID=A0A9W6YTA3_AMBMO|nr:unnamed protein product [Ambrosiozyma monospora]